MNITQDSQDDGSTIIYNFPTETNNTADTVRAASETAASEGVLHQEFKEDHNNNNIDDGMYRTNLSPTSGCYGYVPESKSRYFFGRIASRANGYISTIPIPKVLRSPTFQTAGFLLGMKLNEAELPLESYSSFSSLFSRRLRAESRYPEIIHDDVLLSPVDGLLLNYFRLGNNLKSERITQVKGASYHVGSFLGENLPQCKPGKSYFAAVLYLSPADYHHFHAPCALSFTHRRHFQGDMYPVAPLLAKNMDDLFTSNERVCLAGTWSHGLMYYCPVAAYNVGDIRVVFDPTLRTNRPKLTVPSNPNSNDLFRGPEGGELSSSSSMSDMTREQVRVNEFGSKLSEKFYYNADPSDFDIEVKVAPKGISPKDLGPQQSVAVDLDLDESPTAQLLSSPTSISTCSTADTTRPFLFNNGIVHVESLARIGEFKLGSTVVLIFEALDDFQFVHEWNTKVQIGQLLGYCGPDAANNCRDQLKNYNKRCSPQRSPHKPVTTFLINLDGPKPLSPTSQVEKMPSYRKVVVSSDEDFKSD